MDLEKLYSVDKDAIENGKWMVTREGVDVKIAKLGNPSFNAEVQRLQKPHLAVLRATNFTADVHTDITLEAVAKTILLDWKVESGGETVPYTWELGLEALKKFPDFNEDISNLAASRDNFRPEDIAGK